MKQPLGVAPGALGFGPDNRIPVGGGDVKAGAGVGDFDAVAAG
jgi:hypothetical protein